jgi:hypothetical protein
MSGDFAPSTREPYLQIHTSTHFAILLPQDVIGRYVCPRTCIVLVWICRYGSRVDGAKSPLIYYLAWPVRSPQLPLLQYILELFCTPL